jgi:hypothetical protein
MSATYLRSAICLLFAQHKTNEYTLADTSNLETKQIFEWMNSTHLMTPKDLIRLARAFNLPPKDYQQAHATLLHGYLKDQRCGPGADLILLEILRTPDWIWTSDGHFPVSPAFGRDFQLVVDNSNRPASRSVIRNIAKQIRNEKNTILQ